MTKKYHYQYYVDNFLSVLNNKKLYKNNRKLQIFLRKYFKVQNSNELHTSDLAPSLKSLDLEKVYADNNIEEWGNNFNKSKIS